MDVHQSNTCAPTAIPTTSYDTLVKLARFSLVGPISIRTPISSTLHPSSISKCIIISVAVFCPKLTHSPKFPAMG
jgi:hypothetical protein